MVNKKLNAVALPLHFTQISESSQSKQEVSRRRSLRKITVDSFRDVTLNLESYRFDKTLEKFDSDVEHHHLRKIVIIDNDTSQLKFCNFSEQSDESVLRCANLFSAIKFRLGPSQNDDAQHSEKPFQA